MAMRAISQSAMVSSPVARLTISEAGGCDGIGGGGGEMGALVKKIDSVPSTVHPSSRCSERARPL
eukprot:scaffold106168_cov57-Phaeocystis_antarctica.AAC.1